jgi:hypothetical protein
MIRSIVINGNSKTLSNDNKLLDRHQVTDFLPIGWHKFVQIIFDAATVCQVTVHTLDIKNGTLYVKGEGGHIDIFNRVARTIMIDSALTCMICGNYGRRRKDESGSPPLCGAHYLEYINEEY